MYSRNKSYKKRKYAKKGGKHPYQNTGMYSSNISGSDKFLQPNPTKSLNHWPKVYNTKIRRIFAIELIVDLDVTGTTFQAVGPIIIVANTLNRWLTGNIQEAGTVGAFSNGAKGQLMLGDSALGVLSTKQYFDQNTIMRNYSKYAVLGNKIKVSATLLNAAKPAVDKNDHSHAADECVQLFLKPYYGSKGTAASSAPNQVVVQKYEDFLELRETARVKFEPLVNHGHGLGAEGPIPNCDVNRTKTLKGYMSTKTAQGDVSLEAGDSGVISAGVAADPQDLWYWQLGAFWKPKTPGVTDRGTVRIACEIEDIAYVRFSGLVTRQGAAAP